VLHVGNLNTARDFIDVRDGVSGIVTLIEKGQPGVPVNIATGTAFSGKQILDIFLKISELKVEIITDESLLRPSDEELLLADNSLLKGLGWKQQYTIEETLSAVYEDWLSRV
jgi:GDP-4-dehydro-6-deoxy-D-mannose reductase